LGDLRKILQRPDLLPPGHEVTKQLGPKDYALQLPGRDHPVRVTTDPDYFDLHPESVELWSPGSPVFPILESQQNNSEVDSEILKKL
jgi:hypothetical protein